MTGALGEIRLWAVARIPNNWMLCNGQLLPINTNLDLFELMGNTYGGNGSTNFSLPNLPGPASTPGVQYIICTNGPWPLEGAMDGMFAEIRLWPNAVVPDGWAACSGELLSIRFNQALYSILGTTYGGDGINSFGLPQLAPQGTVRYIISLGGVYPRESDDDDSTPVDSYVSEIRLWAGGFEPAGFALLNQTRSYRINIASTQTQTAELLYSLLGNNYGGTFPVFQLPQLDPLAGTLGSTVSYMMAITGAYPDFP